MTREGYKTKHIVAATWDMSGCPRSLTTWYRLYRQDIEATKALLIGAVGNRVYEQAVNGDPEAPTTYKAQELYLRSQGNWSPKQTVQTREVDEDEEHETAVNRLMSLL